MGLRRALWFFGLNTRQIAFRLAGSPTTKSTLTQSGSISFWDFCRQGGAVEAPYIDDRKKNDSCNFYLGDRWTTGPSLIFFLMGHLSIPWEGGFQKKNIAFVHSGSGRNFKT